YGMSLILLYTASTVYHWLPVAPRTEDLLRRLDHVAIYCLIAGSYTPVCLVTLRGGWGWSLFAAAWAAAAVGTTIKFFFGHLPRWWSAALYVSMGWMALVAVVPLVHNVPAGGMPWLFAGGVAYTVGAIIYGLDRPNPHPDVFGSHDIFHLFV